MSVWKTIVELPPRLAWKRGQAMAVVHRRAFRSFGRGSVIVDPLKLAGVERISVGRGCALYAGLWLEAEPTGEITIGDRVYVGHGAHVHGVDAVEIGDGTMVADGVFIGAGGHDPRAAMAVLNGGPIRIGRDVFIGQRAVVLGGVEIGDGAVVGAGAVVTRDIPAGAVAGGVPARVLRPSDDQGRNNAEERA